MDQLSKVCAEALTACADERGKGLIGDIAEPSERPGWISSWFSKTPIE